MASEAGKTIEERIADLGAVLVPLAAGRYKIVAPKGVRFFANSNEVKNYLDGVLDDA